MVSNGLGGSLTKSMNEFQSNLICDGLEHRRIIQGLCLFLHFLCVPTKTKYRGHARKMFYLCVLCKERESARGVNIYTTNTPSLLKRVPTVRAVVAVTRDGHSIGLWDYLNRKHSSIELP